MEIVKQIGLEAGRHVAFNNLRITSLPLPENLAAQGAGATTILREDRRCGAQLTPI